MILPDVNVLVYAFNEDARDHARYRTWLSQTVKAPEPYAISELVLSAVVRLVTNPRILERPASIDQALELVEGVVAAPNCVRLGPGRRHWSIFTNLCRTARVRGGTVTDAYFAALAIESGSEWITADRGFARFPGLRWRHPLDAAE
ncbi:MAG: type II toxin-antitoxin system VapC family toxin [Thermoleophilaceae bacterium]